jgi:aldehyde:ferredoxin oxidoreductase
MAEGPTYRAFGRGGAVCVMGAKKLKGIVISGDRAVVPANREGLRAVHRAVLENIKAHSQWADTRRQYGTGADMVQMSELGMLPTNNWRQGHYQDVAAICTSTMEWPRRNISCGPHCPAPCSHYIEIKKGPYRGANCDGPEYETIYAFGSSCGVNKFDAIVRAGQMCDENGLDTMSAGLTISFAMECFEKGLIGVEDTQGMELRFGNDEAVIKVLEQLVSGVGFGARLAGGSRRLAREIGESEAFAMQVKGMELGGYECRGLMGQALQFAINNRGGCHHAYGLTARAEVADGTRMQIAGKGEQVKKAAISRILRDSIPMCTFPGLVVTDAMLPEIVSSLSGERWTWDELSQVGKRIICQERFFNMGEGLTRADDTLPLRLLEEAKPDGPTKGATVPLEVLKDDYYRAMGWDLASGNPPDSLLDELEIER